MQFLRVCRICLRIHEQNYANKICVIQSQFSSRNSTVWKNQSLLGNKFVHIKSESNLLRSRAKFQPIWSQRMNEFPCETERQHSSSTLYTPSSEGDHVPFVLNPEIDFERLFGNLQELERNVSARGQEVNVSYLVSLWEKLKSLEQEKICIEDERSRVNKRSKHLNKSGGTKEQKHELQQLGRSLRESLRKINTSIASLSDEFYPIALKLPNHLHPDVPYGSTPKVLETFGSEPELNKSTASQLSEFLKESLPEVHAGFAYLEHDAALMELALTQWASQKLTDQGFVPFSCPSMFKPIALEALGLNPDSTNETYAVETHESVEYLAGVSPLSFIAYYMMSVMEVADLPYRCFTVGRSYNSQRESSHFEGLHKSFQTQKVEVCGVCESTDVASSALFTQFLSMTRDHLSKLPLHYRIVEVPSSQLLPSMHRKCAIEVWIPNIGEFSEVACVYSCTDYISCRIKMRYPAVPSQTAAQSRQRKFLHTVHCTALDTTVLLAALLPRRQVPEVLKPYMPQPFTSK